MKYLFNAFTKLIIFTLVLSLSLGLCSCGNESAEDASSLPSDAAADDNSVLDDGSSDTNEADGFTVEDAAALLQKDRLVTEIFVGNSLWLGTADKAERVLVPEGNQYADFSEIERLLAETYLANSGEREFFLSYPENQEPSVVSQNGKTSVFCHLGSEYTDYADLSTVSVAETDDEKVKDISFTTLTGKKIKVNAVLDSTGAWLLEKGIYHLNPPNTSFAPSLNKVNAGSLKNLTGKTLVIQLFVEDGKTEITPEDEALFHQKVVSATGRITENLKAYGITPQFDYVSRYFDHKGELGIRPVDFDIMIAKTNMGDLKTFAQASVDLTGYDNYFFVVCTKKDMETSFGYCDNTVETQLYYGERILTGASVTDLEIYKSMLCLLGAELPDENSVDKYKEALYKFYFPDDFAFSNDLSKAELSPVTAFLCGFTDELNYLYQTFIPQNK